jgi:hypothetical protein
MKHLIYIAIIVLYLFIVPVHATNVNSDSTNSSVNNNYLGISIGNGEDSGNGGTTSNLRTAPNPIPIMHNELPAYFGPYSDQMWNTQEDTLLPFIIMTVDAFEVETGFLYRNLVKSEVDIFYKKKIKSNKEVKVLNGIDSLENLQYTFIGTTTVHGKKKNSSIACLKQSIIDTGESGGNVFVLMKVSSDSKMSSTTWGFGGSSAGNMGMSGTDAYSAGTSLGISSNTGGPVRIPYMHGIIIKVSDKDYSLIKPLGIQTWLQLQKINEEKIKQIEIDRDKKANNVQ